MQSFKSILRGALAVVGLVAAGAVAATAARQHRQFEAPIPDIHASGDPAVVERGRYLVFGPGHCAGCHGAHDASGNAVEKSPPELSGGMEFHLPIGVFRVPNITPDRETGIGRYSDPELARILRYGVRPNGEAVLPFMPFANLSNDDLRAVISFLRTQAPVSHAVAPHSPNALGYALKAFVLAPRGPSEPIRDHVTPEATPAYGKYLAHSVANCVACHTKMDLRTGAFAGPLFGGGAIHGSTTDPAQSFVAPNLTPDSRWGWIRGWSEDAFVARLHGGRVYPGSPMPWSEFQHMTDSDLRAIYRYLQTLPSATGGPDPADRRAVLTIAER
jgi:mono/diheme cytochrome c family protein